MYKLEYSFLFFSLKFIDDMLIIIIRINLEL